MAKFADRVKVTVDSSTSGTGAVTLSTAVSGYQAVPSALDGASIRYVIELGSAWEIGLGVYTHSTLELTRSLTSSSTGSLLNLNNTAVVFISPAAEDLQYVEVYSSTSDLPSASSNHGRIVHVHGDGAMYFAHGGNWVRLGNHSDITNYTLPTASASTLGGIKIGTGLSIDGSGVVTASGGSSSSSGGSLVPITTTKTTATAGQTVFTGSWKAANIAVFLNGVKLQDSEVTATDTQITISAAAVGDVVEVVEYGAPFASPYASTFPTVTTGATSVTVDYTPDKVAVYKNGVKLRGGGVDFTASNGTSITGFSAFVSGDVIEVVEHGSLAESGGGVTTYANKAAIDAVSSPSEGDLAYDLAADQLYIRTTTEWKRVSVGADESPIVTTEPASTHTLNSDGSTSTVTMVAEDPEGFDITYGIAYPTASNALPNQLASATSINHTTGVFTFDPSTNSNHAGNVKVRLSASDGVSTTTRFVTLDLTFSSHYGERGVTFLGRAWAGSYSISSGIDYYTISTASDASDFGDLTVGRYEAAACSNGSRVICGGGDSGSVTNVIDYITTATTGNATDFGDLDENQNQFAAASDGSRGVFGGGSNGGYSNTMQYVTIATTGDATDFGNLSVARHRLAAAANDTYGLFIGGYGSSGASTLVDYITIASAGNATSFGNLTGTNYETSATSDDTRALRGGGKGSIGETDSIEYMTIGTSGAGVDFGDLTSPREEISACSDGTYAVFVGGNNTQPRNILDRVTIQTTGNATDFGDLTTAVVASASSSGSAS